MDYLMLMELPSSGLTTTPSATPVQSPQTILAPCVSPGATSTKTPDCMKKTCGTITLQFGDFSSKTRFAMSRTTTTSIGMPKIIPCRRPTLLEPPPPVNTGVLVKKVTKCIKKVNKVAQYVDKLLRGAANAIREKGGKVDYKCPIKSSAELLKGSGKPSLVDGPGEQLL